MYVYVRICLVLSLILSFSCRTHAYYCPTDRYYLCPSTIFVSLLNRLGLLANVIYVQRPLFHAYGKLSIDFVLLHIEAIQGIFIQSWGSNFRFIFISPSPLRVLMRVHECHTCFSHSQLHLLLPIRRSPRVCMYV